jgi:hypothetical protein
MKFHDLRPWSRTRLSLPPNAKPASATLRGWDSNLDALHSQDVKVLGPSVVGAVHHRSDLDAINDLSVTTAAHREEWAALPCCKRSSPLVYARCLLCIGKGRGVSPASSVVQFAVGGEERLTGRPKEVRNLLPDVPPPLDILTAHHTRQGQHHIKISCAVIFGPALLAATESPSPPQKKPRASSPPPGQHPPSSTVFQYRASTLLYCSGHARILSVMN